MSYIGRTPILGNFVKLDAITTSATATYNLLNGGVAYFPQTANNCIVSLNGVIQSPTSAYTISGSTIVFSDALTASDSIDFILVLGDVLSIGTPSDGTITSAKLASGISGLISWQSVQTTGFTASAGRGYPCNTTSAAFTVTLPASPSVGDTIILLDYAGTFATNNITLGANSNKIEGGTANKLLTTNREAVTLTYVDSTQGWVSSSGVNEGTVALSPQPYSIDFLVVAGGGSGGREAISSGVGGGGGAGGFRTSTQTVSAGTVITVTVGDGGAVAGASGGQVGNDGSNSSISGSGLTTITSTGGGGGGGGTSIPDCDGRNGGSGGGAGNASSVVGSGNTPSTSPSQGNNGGVFTTSGTIGGGGGGSSEAGNTDGLGEGGDGTASSITGSSVTYAGGGGGCSNSGTAPAGGAGGGGSGAKNVVNIDPVAGTANTGGGGGGGANDNTSKLSGAGGKGVVILSLPTASYSSTTTGSPTVTTSGSNTILTFTGSGSYTT